MRARAKRRAYDMVLREFKKSGIKKAELARRLGVGADRVSKMLGGPGNWTISTVADLLFAISAAQPKWEFDLAFKNNRKNDTRPHWLDGDSDLMRSAPSPQGESPPNPLMPVENSKNSVQSADANFFGLGRR